MVYESGIIKCYNSSKDFGFITVCESKEDVYFRLDAMRGDLRTSNHKSLKGVEVDFIRGRNRRGVAAIEVLLKVANKKLAKIEHEELLVACIEVPKDKIVPTKKNVIKKRFGESNKIKHQAKLVSDLLNVKFNNMMMTYGYKSKIFMAKFLIRIVDLNDKMGDYLQNKSNQLASAKKPD